MEPFLLELIIGLIVFGIIFAVIERAPMFQPNGSMESWKIVLQIVVGGVFIIWLIRLLWPFVSTGSLG